MIDFAAAVRQITGEVSLLVLTTDGPARFLEPAPARGVRCVVRRVTRDQMPTCLSAADAGLSFILSAPSKVACSPIKNGEYLACGLPVVTTRGIGDYSELTERNRIGVVVPSLDHGGLRAAAASLESLLRAPDTSQRCRETASRAVGLREVVVPRHRLSHQRLLGQP